MESKCFHHNFVSSKDIERESIILTWIIKINYLGFFKSFRCCLSFFRIEILERLEFDFNVEK